MHRKIVYNGEIPLGDDFLNSEKNTMIALGMLTKALLGTTTIVDGLACTPTGPASMQVLVGPGSIYSLVNVDGTAFGDLAADTTHQIVKQGISLDNTTLSCPAPSTTGFSTNYLIQVEYEDVDTDSTVLPYFNASNPAVAFSGPANTGTSQNTTRQGQCVVSVKAGAAATTGTQTTPTPDAGFMGLCFVTVANGATSITSGNIHLYTGTGAATGSTAFWSTPFIAEKLNDKVSIATGDLRWQPIGGGGTARTRLSNATTYHVATTGNDTTGDGSSGAPWATIQKAVNVLVASVDLNGFTATIQVADGTYSAGCSVGVPWTGGGIGNVIINGNSTTPDNVIISTSSTCFNVSGVGANLTIQNLKMTVSGTGACINCTNGAMVQNGAGLIFGSATSGYHVISSTNAIVYLNNNYTIIGGAIAHLNFQYSGTIDYSGISEVVTLTGTPVFSVAFAIGTANANLAFDHTQLTFSGAATGPYYSLTGNAT
jgi:hypothetical protein